MLTLPRPDEVRPLAPEELSALPVFPLPRLVFFPGTILPLHLFEARYRAMAADCLASGSAVMSVARISPDHEDEQQGDPPFDSVAGVGRIVAHERLPDGRYHIALQGLGRCRLAELPRAGKPYRQARALRLEDHGQAKPTDVSSLLALTTQLVTVLRQEHPDLSLGVDSEERPGVIADLLADRCVADPDTRQKILETLDVGTRVDMVAHEVAELLARVRGENARYD